jgi:hypothetical protein
MPNQAEGFTIKLEPVVGGQTEELTIINVGQKLKITEVDGVKQDPPVELGPGGTVSFVIHRTEGGIRSAIIGFDTAGLVPLNGHLTVTSEAPKGPVCQVMTPDIENGGPGGRDFGVVPMGSVKRLPFQLHNLGDTVLRVFGPFNITNLSFQIEGVSDGDVIGPGAMKEGSLVFRPVDVGPQSGGIRLFTNAGVCDILSLTGTQGQVVSKIRGSRRQRGARTPTPQPRAR